MTISSYINDNTIDTSNKISELCISVSPRLSTKLSATLPRLLPKLEKLCLVINITDSFNVRFAIQLKLFLQSVTQLKLLQIVVVGLDTQNTDPEFCCKKLNMLTKFIVKLVAALIDIRNDSNYLQLQHNKPVLFKFYVKLCHSISNTQCHINFNSELLSNTI
eukprot:311901_1